MNDRLDISEIFLKGPYNSNKKKKKKKKSGERIVAHGPLVKVTFSFLCSFGVFFFFFCYFFCVCVCVCVFFFPN